MRKIFELKKIWFELYAKTPPFRFFAYLIMTLVIYVFCTWKLWKLMGLFLAVVNVRLEASLYVYWFKLLYTSFYYFFAWLFIHYIMFCFIKPIFDFLIQSLIGIRSSVWDLFVRVFTPMFITIFILILSLEPFLLPLSVIVLFLMTDYVHFKTKFGKKHLFMDLRDSILCGMKMIFFFSLPFINFIIFPLLAKKEQA